MKPLTLKEQQELQQLVDEVIDESKSVVSEYIKNPSELSGSIFQIHHDSPILNE
jgi:hypothetical protein